MKLITTLCLFILISACSSKQIQIQPPLSNLSTVKDENVPAPTTYAFEEFHKTETLKQIQLSVDKNIVFFIKSDGNSDNVFQYHIQNKTVSQVTHLKSGVADYQLDKKGRFIVIQSDLTGTSKFDIFIFDMKTKTTVPLTNGRGIETSILCDLSEDGRKLFVTQSSASSSQYSILSIDVRSRKSQSLVSVEKEVLICSKARGQNIAFVRFVDNNEQHIGIYNSVTKEHKYLASDKDVKNYGPQFSMDGQSIYFISDKDSDYTRLWKFNLVSSKLGPVSLPFEKDIESFKIFKEPRLSLVTYRTSSDSRSQLFSGEFRTPKNIKLNQGHVVQANFRATRTASGVISAQVDSEPIKYFYFNNNELSQLYDSNQSIIPPSHFSKPKTYMVRSFDGLEIPTHFFFPNPQRCKYKCPALLIVHGGPEEHFDPTYFPRFQYLTDQGYIVVLPNVRGSSGFGRGYKHKDNGDWGGGHVKDLIAVADFTKKLDGVDARNVFIAGASFGGFSVLSLLTQFPSSFTAAVVLYGPTELASFVYSWPDFARSYWLKELGFDPKSDRERNEKISPFFNTAKIQVPLQIHQGVNDTSVPRSQSDTFVHRLKAENKSVEYFLYESEGHGFKKFDNIKATYLRMVDFFRRHRQR